MEESNDSNIIMGNQIDNQIDNINDKSLNYLEASTAPSAISQIQFVRLHQEIENEIKDDSFFEEEAKKTNLVFEEKNISPLTLYFHLSNTFEIILMILGTICAIGAGFAAPYMCFLFGDMSNDFSDANIDKDQRDFL